MPLNHFNSNEFAAIVAENFWALATRIVSDPRLMADLGFKSDEAVDDIVVVIQAGDRLHPSLGFDYLGADWRSKNTQFIFDKLEERDRAVDVIYQRVLLELETNGYASARQLSIDASPFQVVYLSRTQAETKQVLDTLLSLGLGTHELSDNMYEKRGSALVISCFEVISYFCTGT